MFCVAGHQPNLYPYGGFFAKAASVQAFVIVDSTQYVKKEYHNRNRIKLLDGNIHWLTVPVRIAGRYAQKINEVEIDNSQDWRKIHRKTLFLNYKKTPFFNEYFPFIEEMLSKEWNMLVDYNMEFIRNIMKILQIDIQVHMTSTEGMSGKATELILDICRKTGAEAYVHGGNSRDYVDFGMLESNGVRSLVQDFNCIKYPQTKEPFSPNLSIIDMLFNCGSETKNLLIEGNKIISL